MIWVGNAPPLPGVYRDDVRGNVIPYLKGICLLHIISLRPNVGIVLCSNQLCGYTQPVSGRLNASFQYKRYAGP